MTQLTFFDGVDYYFCFLHSLYWHNALEADDESDEI